MLLSGRRLLPSAIAMGRLGQIPNVDIDAEGVFKYILIQATEESAQKILVRGYGRCKFHANILEEVEEREGGGGGTIKFKCLGGGRIKHEPNAKNILVYGYSQGFGRANHQKTVEILKERYPNYAINWSNDGY